MNSDRSTSLHCASRELAARSHPCRVGSSLSADYPKANNIEFPTASVGW